MREIWTRLEAWLRAHTPWIFEQLGPPASEEQLRMAEEVMGWTLPADFKDSYRIHDGMIPIHIWMKGQGAFYGVRPNGFLYDAEDFNRLEVIARQWSYDRQSRFPVALEQQCKVEGPIKAESTCQSKIPIAGASNIIYYLDMDPAEGGQVGQVIRYTYDDVRAIYIAPSYGSWLSMLAHLLESGAYVYCPTEDMIVPATQATNSMNN